MGMLIHFEDEDAYDGPLIGCGASEDREAERARMALAQRIVDGDEPWPRFADDDLERCVRAVRARGID